MTEGSYIIYRGYDSFYFYITFLIIIFASLGSFGSIRAGNKKSAFHLFVILPRDSNASERRFSGLTTRQKISFFCLVGRSRLDNEKDISAKGNYILQKIGEIVDKSCWGRIYWMEVYITPFPPDIYFAYFVLFSLIQWIFALGCIDNRIWPKSCVSACYSRQEHG